VTAREGHNSCVLQTSLGFKSLVITGGFCEDDSVTVMRIPRGYNSHARPWGWDRVYPVNRASFVYGASLTALHSISSPGSDNRNSIAKALRFGGFQGGGYSMETNEVWMLTLTFSNSSSEESSEAGRVTANWEMIQTIGVPPRARAYHTATLIHDRYLVIIGGMTSEGSTLEETILDTHTWTWMDISLAVTGEPKGRHGHSVVWDKRRDRLVMFGGGSGTDLIRSGFDNNEVWELSMRGIAVPESLEWPQSLECDQMWKWNHLHGGAPFESSDEDSSEDDELEHQSGWDHLSPIESLNLGRCHNGIKIAPDTVLFLFGGGRMNTNGVLCYNLNTDSFFKPRISGTMPLPRFTGVAEYLDTEGYVFCHGGFNTRMRQAVQDVTLLDVAPYLERNFTSLPVDTNRPCYSRLVRAL
jgi:hypothetical protein